MSVTDPRVAARAALAGWLTSRLSGVTVSEAWPTPGRALTVPAVTVLAGNTINTQYHMPRLWKSTAGVGVNGTVLYSYGRAEIDLQVDCWEAFPASRDVLAQRLEAVVNVPPGVSLGTGVLTDYSSAPGLVLAMSSYYGTYCEYVFDASPVQIPESSAIAQVGEWRMTYFVKASLFICNQDTVPLLKSAVAQLSLNGEAPESITVA